jgi:predicted nucleic acid-binding Zn ribbon protein
MNNCQASFRQALKTLGVYFKADGPRFFFRHSPRKSGNPEIQVAKAQGANRRIHIRRSIRKGGLGIIYFY